MNVHSSWLLALFAALAFSAQVPILEQNALSDAGPRPVHTMKGWSWEDCGSPDDIVAVTSINVSPDPPQRGKNLTVTAVGTVKKPILDGAEAMVTVKLGLIKLLTKTFDLCEEAQKNNLEVTCPVQEGDYTIVQSVALPREIPPGKFGVDVQAYSVDDEDMVCLKLKVDFLHHFGY